MFNDKYKNAMDNISPDANTKEEILDKIILKEELKNRKNPALPWRVAFACVACVAILLGVIFVPKDNIISVDNKISHETLSVAKSYNEIYKLIKPKKKVICNWQAVDEETIEEITYEGELADDFIEYGDASVNTNTTAKPGALKGDDEGAVTDTSKNDDFSTTTTQVEGVAEADIVKSDGKYIYYLIGNDLSIYQANGKESALISKTILERQKNESFGDMFLKDDRLILLQQNDYINDKNYVTIIIYDISDPLNPKRIAKSCQEGSYNSSRMVGDYIYLVSNSYINIASINKDDPSTFVPTIETNDVCKVVPADSIYRYEEEKYIDQYTVIGAFNYKDGAMSDTASLLGGTDTIYCSQGNIILADRSYSNEQVKESEEKTVISKEITKVSRLAITDGKIEYKTTGEIDGVLENQFFIDEYNGNFRFVSTVTKGVEKRYKFENENHEVVSHSIENFAQLTVLDNELKKIGEITDLAQGESVYSVRFMGDIAYFVTFRQTDPLFSADLSDPTNPKILGQLKIPGFSEYMYPYGNGLLLGFGMDADENTGRTNDLKLSMFNVSDPSNVIEQDKTIVEGYNYSTALDNHKSMLVSPTKNLIGFVAFDNRGLQKYMVYEYIKGGFNLKAQIAPTYETKQDYWKYYDSIRGLFIGQYFYLVSDTGLQVFDVNDFAEIAIIK